MKATLCLFVVLVTCLSGYGQKTFIENGKLNGILPLNADNVPAYTILGSAESVSKEELFKRGRKWFTKTYNSSKSVLQVSDLSTGELSGKGTFIVPESLAGGYKFPINHSLILEVKEGKYRITLTGFKVDEPKLGYCAIDAFPLRGRAFYKGFYPSLDKESTALIASLEKALKTTDDF